MPSRIAALAIAAVDPRVVADFWSAALGWPIVDSDDVGISVAPSDGSRDGIDVLAVPDPKATQNRLHLDLRADEDTTTAEELTRLLGLGARRVDVGQAPDAGWIVLADPEGNEFCLLGRA